jgi:hypothetical protein
MLKVEGVGYNVQGHQGVHMGVVGTRVKNVIYIYNWGFLGSIVGRTLEDTRKVQKNDLYAMKPPKTTSWMLNY